MTTEDMLKQATARPWHTVGETEIRHAARVVCDTAVTTGYLRNGTSEADAALIVRAVNSYEAMRTFIGTIARMTPDGEEMPDGSTYEQQSDDAYDTIASLIRDARALQLAEGKSGGQ